MSRKIQIPNESKKIEGFVPKTTTKYVFPHKFFSTEANKVVDEKFYEFQYPGEWTSIFSSRKAVALRSVYAESLIVGSISASFHIEWYSEKDGFADEENQKLHSVNHDIIAHVFGDTTIYEVFNFIIGELNKQITDYVDEWDKEHTAKPITNKPQINAFMGKGKDGSDTVELYANMDKDNDQDSVAMTIGPLKRPYGDREFENFAKFLNQDPSSWHCSVCL